MQGNAFQGAFFAASPTMKNANLTEETLFTAIEAQLQAKFGGKGKRVVADNLRVVRRGYTELTEITDKQVGVTRKQFVRKDAGLPVMLQQLPAGDGGIADIHRFWEQTGNFYLTGKGSDNLVDPFIGTSLMPAATGVFRDMTGIRFEHPVWIAENCTACGNCYTECPDSAIPGLVSSVADVFNTVINRIETTRHADALPAPRGAYGREEVARPDRRRRRRRAAADRPGHRGHGRRGARGRPREDGGGVQAVHQ